MVREVILTGEILCCQGLVGEVYYQVIKIAVGLRYKNVAVRQTRFLGDILDFSG